MTEPVAPPPGWTPEPRQRRRRRWVWILVGVLTTIVVLLGVGIGLFVTRQKPVIDAANAFLDDVGAGRFDDAYGNLCEADREEIDEETFAAFAAELRNDLDDPSVNFLGVDINGNRATVDFDPDTSDSADFDENLELELRDEDGEWRVCELFRDLS